jgi:hypothetical protein
VEGCQRNLVQEARLLRSMQIGGTQPGQGGHDVRLFCALFFEGRGEEALVNGDSMRCCGEIEYLILFHEKQRLPGGACEVNDAMNQ